MRGVERADDPPRRQHLGADDAPLLGVGRAYIVCMCVYVVRSGWYRGFLLLRPCVWLCAWWGVCGLLLTRVGPRGDDDGAVLLLQHAPVAHDVHVARGHGEDALGALGVCVRW